MDKILINLISTFLGEAIALIDSMMTDIVDISLYSERYMTTLTGTDILTSMFNVVFGFGIGLIILKFLKKSFEIYILWSDGDADDEPLGLLTNFFRAIAIAISFPVLYGWMADVVSEMSSMLLVFVGDSTSLGWAAFVSGVSSMGLLSSITGLIFVIVYIMLYIQFLMRGLEMFVLRVGLPLACVGLLDNDRGVFKPYITKFFQSMLAVVVQLILCKLGLGLMFNMHMFWGIACMMLAIRTPKFLSEFIVSTGGAGGGVANKVYASARLVQMAKGLVK